MSLESRGEYLIDDVTADSDDLNLLDGAIAGTAVASKVLVLGANKQVNVLVVADGGLSLGAGAGTAITATANELNLLDTAVAGTAVASKALVLGANKEVNVLVVADGGLSLGAGAGTAITATADELNLLDAGATEPADGAWAAISRWAKAEYAFGTDGGAISAIDLGVNIPDDAIIIGGFVEVLTTLTDGGDDDVTGAISVEGADDIVAAVAVSDGTNPWDAGIHPIAVDRNSAATLIKTTAARAVTFTIAVDTISAGKFNVWLEYLVGEA